MIYTALVFAVVVTALLAASRRDRRAVWRPYAAASTLLVIAACAVALEGCPPWDRPACGSPRSFVCVNDQPHVCSPSGRLTPIGDTPCATNGAECVIGDGGVAHCEVRDAQR